jgi:hypothetical protein
MQPKSRLGYIVAVAPENWADRPDPEFRIVFLKRRTGNWERYPFTGGSLPNAEIFGTYQDASEAALSYTKAHPGEARILRVQTSAPVSMIGHFPITLIDALAEL